MNANDKQVARKIAKDFGGATSLGLGALEIAAGLLGADDVAAVVAHAKDALTRRGIIVRGPGLHASPV
jgi:hypothetical protein